MTRLYTKYIGDWGGTATIYRFDAIKDGKVVKSVTKEPVREIRLEAEADHTILTEQHSYDVALVRIRAVDDHGNVLPFYQEPVRLITEGDISIIGPDTIALQGGMVELMLRVREDPVGELCCCSHRRQGKYGYLFRLRFNEPQGKTSDCKADICFLGSLANEYPAKQDVECDSTNS